jgi:glucose-induced degradation protein 4
MPNTCPVIPDQIQPETPQAIKICSFCSHLLVDSSNAVLVQDDSFCVWCHNGQLQVRPDDTPVVDGIGALHIRAPYPTITTQLNTVPPVHILDEGIFGDGMDMDEVPTPSLTASSPYTPISALSSTASMYSQPTTLSTSRPVALSIHTHSTTPRPVTHQSRNNTSKDTLSHSPRVSSSSPDPLLDITHIRVRSQGHHCLYPGSVFQGTQKSGRNSYEVTVNIVVSRISTLTFG